MAIDVKVPSVGESVKEGMIHSWKVKDGEYIERDQVLLELETDKATVEVVAEQSGSVKILKTVGETVGVGEVIAKIDTSAAKPAESKASKAETAPKSAKSESRQDLPPSPSVRRISEESGVPVSAAQGTGKGGRVTKEDMQKAIEQKPAASAPSFPSKVSNSGARQERREPMSMLRRRVAERLLQAQSTAAILTTFNEIDMTAILQLRANYKDAFKDKFGVS